MKNLFFILSIAALIGLASCDKNDDVFTQEQEEVQVDKNKSTLKSSFSFNRSVVANYAQRHTEYWKYCTHHTNNDDKKLCDHYYNKAYNNYGKRQGDGGLYGDCANFVSQCLFAGGLPTDNAKLNKDNIASNSRYLWGYRYTNVAWGSQAWRNTADLRKYLKSNYSTSEYLVKSYSDLQWNLKYLQVGDLIIMLNGEGHAYNHVVIINKVIKSGSRTTDVLYSGHTWNDENRSFKALLDLNTSKRKTYRVLRLKI